MSARARRRSTAAAVALVASVTAGLALTGCGPDDTTGADGNGSTATNAPATSGQATATNAPTKQPVTSTQPALNGTAHNGLTISDSSRYVVMNGTRVDFGTQVRDLAWSPDGSQAAFVDGDGDLVVSAPDGSGRTVVARNPGGENWSHPTWQVRKAGDRNGAPPMDNLLFAARKDGVSRLYGVPATAHEGTPKVLSLNPVMDENSKLLPKTGNVWPSAAGGDGSAVYANVDDGQVYIRDDYMRQQGAPIGKGSEPAQSPDDDEGFVFVRSVAGHDHLFREIPGDNGPTFVDRTPNATTDYTEPAFSPDGKTIAARTPDGIVTLPADGTAPPVLISGYPGLPAYRANAQ